MHQFVENMKYEKTLWGNMTSVIFLVEEMYSTEKGRRSESYPNAFVVPKVILEDTSLHRICHKICVDVIDCRARICCRLRDMLLEAMMVY